MGVDGSVGVGVSERGQLNRGSVHVYLPAFSHLRPCVLKHCPAKPARPSPSTSNQYLQPRMRSSARQLHVSNNKNNQ